MLDLAQYFTLQNILYSFIGVSVFWGLKGRDRLQAYLLSDLVNLFPLKRRQRAALEFLIFATLGVVVGIGVATPTTVPQALTAGFAWTGAVARYSRS
jgi:hypothetical protein